MIEVDGVPMWRRQVDLVQRLGAKEIILSAGSDWSPAGGPWKIVADKVAGFGPLGGLQAALAAMSTDRLLVLAVDMPAMSEEFLGRLAGDPGPGVVPEMDGYFQGLAAIYPRSITALVDEALQGEDRSVQAFISRAVAAGLVSALPVTGIDKALFRNVNRPEDL